MSGWFAMSRAMFRHPIFKGRCDRVGVWAWMLATAAWKETRQDDLGRSVVVQRGQLLTSYRQMSEATGQSIKTCRNLVGALQKEGAIEIKAGTGVGMGSGTPSGKAGGTGQSLITICNYDKYQSPKGEVGTGKGRDEGTAGAQQGHTKEQGNNLTTPPSEEASASQPVQVSVVTAAMWGAGKQYLTSQGIKNPGGVIGRWVKDNDPLTILNAIEMAQRAGTQDPIPYITQVLKGSNDDQLASRKTHRNDPNADPTLRTIFGAAGAF